MNYFVLVQNTNDVVPIGEFPSIIEAERHAEENSDHYAHGERWIVISKGSTVHLLSALLAV